MSLPDLTALPAKAPQILLWLLEKPRTFGEIADLRRQALLTRMSETDPDLTEEQADARAEGYAPLSVIHDLKHLEGFINYEFTDLDMGVFSLNPEARYAVRTLLDKFLADPMKILR